MSLQPEPSCQSAMNFVNQLEYLWSHGGGLWQGKSMCKCSGKSPTRQRCFAFRASCLPDEKACRLFFDFV